MDSRHRMEVGINRVDGDVVDHEPAPPAFLTARLLSTRALAGAVPPRSHTTIFPDTFAGSSTGWLSVHRKALTHAIRISSGDAARSRQHDGGRSDAGSQRRAGVHGAVAELDLRFAGTVVSTCGDRRQPRADVRYGARRRAAVPRRRGDEHARARGEQERDFDRVEIIRRRAGDRVVEHVNAVDDGLIDRGNCIAAIRAATSVPVVPADLVNSDSRSRRNTVDAPETPTAPLS